MKIAYNPADKSALTEAPNNKDITFDLSGRNIYAQGIKFSGTDTVYNVFKKHTSNNSGGYNGLVPVPSYTTTTTRFLREDSTWVDPTADCFKYRGMIDTHNADETEYIDNYIDSTDTTSSNPLFTILQSGTYLINKIGHTDLLVSFYGGGSASSLELKTSWTAGSSLEYRRTVDSNRICDSAWKTLLDNTNYLNILKNTHYTKTEVDSVITTTTTTLTNYVNKQISDLIDNAPETLDTLKEIADYLTNGSIAGSIVNQLSKKVNKSGDIMTGDLIFAAGESDRFIKFDSSATGSGGTHSWRIGYLGSGSDDNNLFVLLSSQATNNTWTNVLLITPVTRKSIFSGDVGVKNLIITNQSSAKHIMFSRGTKTDYPYNYIAAPEGGIISILPNGVDNTSATGMLFSSNGFHPASHYGYSLGTPTTKWLNTYSGKFITGICAGYFINGMTSSAIIYDNYQNLDHGVDYNSHHSFLGISSNSGNKVVYGGYNDDIGFYGYKSTRLTTENGYDWSLLFNSNTGVITASNRIVAPLFHFDYTSASSTPLFYVGSRNIDVSIFRVYSSDGATDDDYKSKYGYTLKYLGTKSGKENYLNLYADNLSATSLNLSISINNTGQIGLRCNPVDTNTLTALGNVLIKPETNTNAFLTVDQGIISLVGTTESPTWESPGAIRWAETINDSQPLSLVYTSYNSYRAPAGLLLLGKQGNEWLEVRGNIYGGGFCKFNSSDNHVLLGAGGHKEISEFVLKSELSLEILKTNIITIEQKLVVSNTWMDTGIEFKIDKFLQGSGSYIVQLNTSNGLIFTGYMTIDTSNNFKDNTDEIVLHGGGNQNYRYYLRTVYTNSKPVKLLIARSSASTANTQYTFTFKFKKII